ncbi:unnamed protein product [Cochlearia groenlandica]
MCIVTGKGMVGGSRMKAICNVYPRDKVEAEAREPRQRVREAIGVTESLEILLGGNLSTSKLNSLHFKARMILRPI